MSHFYKTRYLSAYVSRGFLSVHQLPHVRVSVCGWEYECPSFTTWKLALKPRCLRTRSTEIFTIAICDVAFTDEVSDTQIQLLFATLNVQNRTTKAPCGAERYSKTTTTTAMCACLSENLFPYHSKAFFTANMSARALLHLQQHIYSLALKSKSYLSKYNHSLLNIKHLKRNLLRFMWSREAFKIHSITHHVCVSKNVFLSSTKILPSTLPCLQKTLLCLTDVWRHLKRL